MAKQKTEYVCSECNHVEPKWAGKCPACGNWNTLEEQIAVATPKKAQGASPRNQANRTEKPERLKEIKAVEDARIVTPDDEFNRVMGGGIVRDSVTILTAPPGAGKSTKLIEISNMLGHMNHRVLYCSGEESKKQVKLRAERVCKDLSENVWFKAETCLNVIEEHISEIDPDIVIIDSLQTVYREEFSQAPGSPTQEMECTYRLRDIAKSPKRQRAVFIVGQMTKQDELAGNREIEHAVDAVLVLEGDRSEQLRLLRSVKNRFGTTDEVGLYLMDQEGLIPIKNPSEFFMTKRDIPVAGSALTMTREGTRNIVIEIESLLEKTFYGYPTRVGEGINKQQLQILSATLEKRGHILTSDKDVYVKVVGGLKPKETSVNLGVVMSMVSSIRNEGIATDTIFVGEVGLTGEIKAVPHLESRIKEAERLGFNKMYVPKRSLRNGIQTKKLEIIEVDSLVDVITHVYGKIGKNDVA